MNPILCSPGKGVLYYPPLFAFLLILFLPGFSNRSIGQTAVWDGSSWSSTPNSTVDAVIASSITPGGFVCSDLTVDAGKVLTLGSGVAVNIHGSFTNNGNGTSGVGTLRFESGASQSLSGNPFTFNGVVEVSTGTTLITNSLLTIGNGGSLMHGSNTPYGGGTVSGTITFEKSIGNSSSGWRLFSLPVDAAVNDFETGLNTLCSNHSPSGERNVYYWDASAGAAAPFSGNYALGWTEASTSSDENKAYTIYLDNSNGSGLFDFSSSVSICGTPNNGTKTFAVGYTFDPASAGSNSSQRGWNLIPNYFPSNLSVYSLINDANFSPTYKAVHIWNQSTGQYVGVNQSGMNSYKNTGVSVYGTIRQIPPFMGFWVKATSLGQSIQLKNTMRTSRVDSLPANTYFKREFDIFRITVQDAEGHLDQFSVCFDESANEGVDMSMDIFKFRSNSAEVPTLYTMVEGEMVSLNALPLKESYSMPLFMESLKHGMDYTYSPETTEYSNTFDVELVDNKTGVKTSLLEKDYSFKHDAFYEGARFTLNFTRKTATALQELYSHENSWAFTNETGIGVSYSNPNFSTTAVVEIYTLTGQKLFTSNRLSSGETVMFKPTGKGGAGVYIAHVISNGSTKTIKVVY